MLGRIRSAENGHAMLTDRAPRKPPLLTGFLESDSKRNLDLQPARSLEAAARAIDSSLATGALTNVRQACAEFLTILASFYELEVPAIRILAARRIRSREGGWATELFGDYHPKAKLIRIWMRTAVRKHVTSFGTFLSTLCHEFCHHLDYQRFKYGDSWHTRGLYERTAALYHRASGTPPKCLFWFKVSGGLWRIDWPRTNRGF